MRTKRFVKLSVTTLIIVSFIPAMAASTRVLSGNTTALTVNCGESHKNSELTVVFRLWIKLLEWP